MARQPDEILQQIIGQQAIMIARLQSQVEALIETVNKYESQMIQTAKAPLELVKTN